MVDRSANAERPASELIRTTHPTRMPGKAGVLVVSLEPQSAPKRYGLRRITPIGGFLAVGTPISSVSNLQNHQIYQLIRFKFNW